MCIINSIEFGTVNKQTTKVLRSSNITAAVTESDLFVLDSKYHLKTVCYISSHF